MMSGGDHTHDRSQASAESQPPAYGDNDTLQDGAANYTVTVGMNSSKATYQDATGAPVETDSPLGYSVNLWVTLALNINQMVGTGIFSTRKCFYSQCP